MIDAKIQTNTNPDSLVTYKELIREIGKHFAMRKGLLFKRVVLIIWPLAVAVAIFEWGDMKGYFQNFHEHLLFITLGLLWVLFGAIYSVVVGSIFSIEKNIWIDSYFDKKNLSQRESWRIATKLLFPSVKVWFFILFRYYIPPIAAVLVLLVALWNVSIAEELFIILYISSVVIAALYIYYIRIHFRYLWFVFLDNYGTDRSSITSILREVRTLNSIAKGDTFKKALVVNLGSDVVNIIVRTSVELLTEGINSLGGAGRVVGAPIRVVGREMSRQTTSYARSVAFYLMYKQARLIQHGNSQHINEKLYELADLGRESIEDKH